MSCCMQVVHEVHVIWRSFLRNWAEIPNEIFRRSLQLLTLARYFDGTAEDILIFRKRCAAKKLFCPTSDLDTIALKFRLNCTNIFEECQWNGIPFNCCQFFHPIHTFLGPCFAINSQSTRSQSLSMISNVENGPGTLRVKTRASTQVFITGPYDVPDFCHRGSECFLSDIRNPITIIRGVSVTEVVNDPSVREATLGQRRCRFPDENPLSQHDRYSYTGCLVECRMRAHLRSCNCTSPLMPRVDSKDVCNTEGLFCLMENVRDWSILRQKWEDEKMGLYCPCLLNCDSMDIRTTYEGMRKGEFSFEIFMTQLPTIRYQRVIVRSLLDLIVNIGGTLGLLMGASLLSLVEVIHFFVLPVGRAVAARTVGGAAMTGRRQYAFQGADDQEERARSTQSPASRLQFTLTNPRTPN